MTQRAKRWKAALILAGAVLALQLAASGLVRTRHVRGYLITQLERTFGRHVEVEEFTVSLLPSPQLDAGGITVSEDPAFGNEYFLRAEHLSAGLRWLGLLRGRFEFGTVSLSRPSLILARNEEGRWNLEGWLPPGRAISPSSPGVAAPAAAAETTNRLEKIDIDDGRLDFKLGDVKQPFAFTGVSGSIEQMSPGRWELHLEAQPWRSGVQLQSTGTLRVQGEVAGTSARLQPASLRIHWGEVSLADLFRLLQGQDKGVRGLFALDAMAESGVMNDGTERTGEWSYSLQARATQIHRWDLTERPDNPRVNLDLKGMWDPARGSIRASELVLETPKSNLRGSASLMTKPETSLEIHIDSSGIQAADLLEWYRAFHPGVSEGIAAHVFFTGGLSLSGLPLSLNSAGFSTQGGTLTVPGFANPIRIGPLRGGMERRRFAVEPAVFTIANQKVSEPPPPGSSPRTAGSRATPGVDEISLSLMHDFETRVGVVTLTGHIEHSEDVFKIANAFGRSFNHGWDLTGPVRASLLWGWGQPSAQGWNGQVDFDGAKLQAAGLNLPLQLADVKLQWEAGKRTARIGKVEGFGAAWSGTIKEDGSASGKSVPWHFNLHADHLDAKELDRWVGPRARPNWLQRLMNSLLGGGSASAPASALLRLLDARGELQADEFNLEQMKLKRLLAKVSLKDLKLSVEDATASWAGGMIQGSLSADFSPQPKYTAAAKFERVNLAQIPFAGNLEERVSGSATGSLALQTEGIGRDILLQKMQGEGNVRLSNVGLRGWDVAASLASGSPRSGSSRWSSGDAKFRIANQEFIVSLLRLNAPQAPVVLKGSVSFRREANLTLESANEENRKGPIASSDHVLNLAGPLDRLRVSLAARVAQQPGD
ncbi:MAG TPA: AsmA family protein [Candidatus Acidoferrum sp.]|nr:AsmA family protein [Candidatus Acidoferrum sp.]